jgi:quercetin dioxygenase-like cupin family protein
VHVASSDLRAVRATGLELRFATLGGIAYVQADVPAGGSAGTLLEEPCSRPHWGFVLDGEVELERGADHDMLGPATAFHVPAGGPPHRFRADGRARLAAFEPIEPAIDLSDAGLRSLGLVPSNGDPLAVPEALVPAPSELDAIAEGRVVARGDVMGSLVLTRARFGPKSGYATNPCQLSHWGIVTSGTVVLETSEGAEILGPGDVFACASGEPGHRILAAGPASLIDYTPLDEVLSNPHAADWRRETFGAIRGRRSSNRRVQLSRL